MDLSTLPRIVEALDAFLVEVSLAKKRRAIEEARRDIYRDVSKFFSKQGRLFLKEHERFRNHYAEALNPDDFERIWDLVALKTIRDFVEALYGPMGMVMGVASEMTLADMKMGVAWDLSNPRAVEWLRNYTEFKLGRDVNRTTAEEIRKIIEQSVDEGWSYGRTSREIRNRFEGFAGKMPQLHIRNRAEGIAVTESRRAYERANLEMARSMKETGLEMEKSWYASAGGDACDICQDNERDGWIEIEESFSSGDDAPPAHPYCRCDMLIQRKGAME